MSFLPDILASRRQMPVFVAIGIVWGGFAGLVPPVKSQIGASDAAYGGLVLISAIGAVAAMWLAPLAQRLFGVWALIFASLLMAFGFAIVGLSGGPIFFVMAMLCAACGSGIADVLANAEISDTEARTGRALMNLNHATYSFAFAAGSLMTGQLRAVEWAPHQILWIIAGIVLLLCTFMVSRNNAPALGQDSAKGAAELPLKIIWIGGSVVLAAFMIEASTEGWSALHIERTLSGSPENGARGPAVFGLMMGFGRLFGHVLAQRVSDLILMGVAAVVSAIGLMIAAFAQVVWQAWVGFAIAGLGISVVVPLAFALVGRTASEEARLPTISRVAAMGYAAFFLGPPLMGGIAELVGLRASFAVISVLLALVGVALVPALARAVRN